MSQPASPPSAAPLDRLRILAGTLLGSRLATVLAGSADTGAARS